MKLHRFYIPLQKIVGSDVVAMGNTVTVSFPELAHQMKNVLKLQHDERIIFFNGNGLEYLSSIVSYVGKEGIQLKLEEVTENDVSFDKEIYLFFSIIKKDNVDLILQKGTEIGVSHFIPVISSRSEKKDINIVRAERILVEATEQCGRKQPPTLHPVMKLGSVFEKFKLSFIVFEKNNVSLREKNIKDNSIGLMVGPEGGWTKEELEFFKSKKLSFVSLGNTTLRAETAAIVGSAVILEK